MRRQAFNDQWRLRVSLFVSLFLPVPRDTAHIAETVFGSDNLYLTIGDQAERLLTGIDLAPLDPVGNQSIWTLTMCALVTILQFLENLPDHRAAAATRTRPDWKYMLHLPAAYPGFDHRRLCEFRRHVARQPDAQQTLQLVLDRLSQIMVDRPGLTVSTVLSAVCAVSRLERLIEAMQLMLEAVAAIAPEWLRTIALPHWYERYNRLQTTHVLPRSSDEQATLACAIDADALYLLEALVVAEHGWAVMPEVQMVCEEWAEQFRQSAHQTEWRGSECLNCDHVCGSVSLAEQIRFTS
jgi:hypothetical protein